LEDFSRVPVDPVVHDERPGGSDGVPPDAPGWAVPGVEQPGLPPPPRPSGWPDAGGQPPQTATYPPPGYGGVGDPSWGYRARQTHPQATTALVLGVLSIAVCGVFTAIPAIVVGNRVLRDVRASGGQLDGEGSGRTGVVCGWVSVGLTAVSVLAVIAILMLGSTVERDPVFEPVGRPPSEVVPEFESPPLTSPSQPGTAPERSPFRGD
jgi:hypothetical protein